ncbi:MAG: hypothetical protein IIW73_06810 [Clostridia bacterium]|nr:hypothetical protein [Clostridia bacterium]
MAKQSGIHQLRGKIRGMSYYRQKGVKDGLARQINDGMSKRVKEDVGYLNTRLNAREFGSAGSFAGAAIRAISERQRTMLKDFATGNLAKAVRDVIIQDTTHPWGERNLTGTAWQAEMLARISSYAKNDFSSYVGGNWLVDVSSGDNGIEWANSSSLPAGWGSLLAAKGATGAYIDMYSYQVELQEFAGTSDKGFSETALVQSADLKIGEADEFDGVVFLASQFDGANAANKMQGFLVVVRPYQEVGTQKYIRQELCTFAIFGVGVAQN